MTPYNFITCSTVNNIRLQPITQLVILSRIHMCVCHFTYSKQGFLATNHDLTGGHLCWILIPKCSQFAMTIDRCDEKISISSRERHQTDMAETQQLAGLLAKRQTYTQSRWPSLAGKMWLIAYLFDNGPPPSSSHSHNLLSHSPPTIHVINNPRPSLLCFLMLMISVVLILLPQQAWGRSGREVVFSPQSQFGLFPVCIVYCTNILWCHSYTMRQTYSALVHSAYQWKYHIFPLTTCILWLSEDNCLLVM